MHLPYHPAPGFGDLLPGHFVVPQNPIRDAGTALVPSVQAAAHNKVTRVAKMGDLLPGAFTVPQNPLLAAIMGAEPSKPDAHAAKKAVAKLHGLGCGCGCAGACGGDHGYNYYYGMSGMASPILNVPAPKLRVLPRYDTKRFSSYADMGYPSSGLVGQGDTGYEYEGGLSGLGQALDTSSVSNFMTSLPGWLQAPSFISSSVPNWALYGGLAAAAFLLLSPGGSDYRQQSRSLRSQYRGYRRLGRAISA